MFRSRTRHLPAAIAVTAAAFCAAAAPAKAAPVCGAGMYAYAGFALDSGSRGVSATIDQAGPLDVRAGHVAGWIGVVEPHAAAAWLQVGLSALPGDRTSRIYYEVAFPGRAPAYHALPGVVGPGQPHRFGVLELDHRPGWWRVWVDGLPVTPPLHLRGSHNRWTADVTGESYTGTTSGRCNAYAYAFSRVSLFDYSHRERAGLSGPAQASATYTVVRRSPSSFIATSVGDATSA
jgi:hypothetical protein